MSSSVPPAAPGAAPSLGALAAGFGFVSLALAQPLPQAPASAASAPAQPVMPAITVNAEAEPQGRDGVQATTTRIGKGQQDVRDVPQSLTVVTERLIDDRNQDTLKRALSNVGGISFEAAEGGTVGDNIRIRGFPARGDIYIDGQRDIAQYNRDTYALDRIEVLRGSASMLFGRGSTGGVINQVNKVPLLFALNEVSGTLGSDGVARLTGDFNLRLADDAAARVNVMRTAGGNNGATTDREGIAPAVRWGIGGRDEFLLGAYYLAYDDVPNYGIGWLNNRQAPIPAKNFYGMASDHQQDSAAYAYASWTHRFERGGELRTSWRDGRFERELWATTVRFTGNAASACPSTAPATIDGSTPLCRGNQTRAGEDRHRFLQSDYNGRFELGGMRHEITAGVDLADENSTRYSYSQVPAKPPTTVGTPNDGASVADTRVRDWQTEFDARATGAFVQDILSVTPQWKLLLGLRHDSFEGRYERTVAAGGPLQREDSLWSRRFGLMYQPDERLALHLSHGTSFNTSGDLYQYDPAGANTPPEQSRNLELGARYEAQDGRLSLRSALFRSEKTNERNTDAASANPTNYLLSGRRHATGVEFDAAGRIGAAVELYASLAYIFDAEIDESTNPAQQGTWPGLTPRTSGSVWVTWQADPKVRLGAGATGMSSRTPADGSVQQRAHGHVTLDAMAEFRVLEETTVRLNVVNLGDVLTAEQIYRGHIVAGQPRTLQFNVTTRF